MRSVRLVAQCNLLAVAVTILAAQPVTKVEGEEIAGEPQANVWWLTVTHIPGSRRKTVFEGPLDINLQDNGDFTAIWQLTTSEGTWHACCLVKGKVHDQAIVFSHTGFNGFDGFSPFPIWKEGYSHVAQRLGNGRFSGRYGRGVVWDDDSERIVGDGFGTVELAPYSPRLAPEVINAFADKASFHGRVAGPIGAGKSKDVVLTLTGTNGDIVEGNWDKDLFRICPVNSHGRVQLIRYRLPREKEQRITLKSAFVCDVNLLDDRVAISGNQYPVLANTSRVQPEGTIFLASDLDKKEN